MKHIEQDELILLAFADLSEKPEAVKHLAVCGACRQEVAAMQQLAGIVSQAREMRALPAPPPGVWAAIAAQTGAVRRSPQSAGSGPAAPPPISGATAAARPADGRPRGATGPTRPGGRRRWLRLAMTAAVVVTAVAVGAVGGVWWSRPQAPAQPAVLAAADLAAFGDTPASALGRAQVVQGHRLRLQVNGLPAVDGYYEVWLIDPDTLRMFSIGTLGAGADSEFTLPPDADLSTYRLVDVSAEHFDNNTAHSGDSLLRGLLA
ncbi:anti-sigma factor [Catellatospora vulcania]|uniref:anti-sigma factor n=1 Tax=Catellatospora vulcania TaxID=1460450 RepID=UPI0012D4575D|nr:anti-sigma factor [Catellatospora vulcania]